MGRDLLRCFRLGAIGGVFIVISLLVGPRTADAQLMFHGSAGIPYVLSGGAGVVADRGQMTLDLALGYQLSFVRAELPLVFGVNRGNIHPSAGAGLLGVKPQLKIFPISMVYGKVATELLFARDAQTYFRSSFGLGLEFSVWGQFALAMEINMNPFHQPSTILPVEGRVGVTVLF